MVSLTYFSRFRSHRDQQDHSLYNDGHVSQRQCLPEIRNSEDLEDQDGQGYPGDADGDNEYGPGPAAGKAAREIDRQGNARQEQGADGQIAQQHGVLREHEGGEAGVRHLPQPQQQGEAAQVEHIQGPGLFAGHQDKLDRHDGKAQQTAENGQDQDRQVRNQALFKHLEEGAHLEGDGLISDALVHGGHHNAELLAGVAAVEGHSDPVAADAFTDGVGGLGHQTVEEFPVQVDLAVLVDQIKGQGRAVLVGVRHGPAVGLPDADGR